MAKIKSNEELIREHFAEYPHFGARPINTANGIAEIGHTSDSTNYRIYFTNGEVSDWSVGFDYDEVVFAEVYNVVIDGEPFNG